MTSLNRFRCGCLFLAILLLAPAAGHPSEKNTPRPKDKTTTASTVDSKILLSIRIAKARKARRGIAYYTSVARQRKNRGTSTAHPPSSAR